MKRLFILNEVKTKSTFGKSRNKMQSTFRNIQVVNLQDMNQEAKKKTGRTGNLYKNMTLSLPCVWNWNINL
jgi:hypothetical protein